MKQESKIEILINCDYSILENKKAIKDALCEIKPIAKYFLASVEMNELERVLQAIVKRYRVSIQYITHHRLCDGSFQWQISTKRDDTQKWLGSISGRTIDEIMAKCIIALFDYIEIQEIPTRNIEQEEAELKRRLVLNGKEA